MNMWNKKAQVFIHADGIIGAILMTCRVDVVFAIATICWPDSGMTYEMI
jgi:hypothetical protein